MTESRDTLRQRHGPNYRWRVLLTVMIGTVASIMSSTIVNVAVPDMSRVFTLGPGACAVDVGRFHGGDDGLDADHALAARRATATAAPTSRVVLLLMAGGIGGGLGWSFEWVLAMRVAEGLAAGVLQPIPAHHHHARLRAARSRARRSASSAWAWCWRRRSARASAACWSRRSAGARSSSSSCRSAWLRCGWRGATCRHARRAASRSAASGASTCPAWRCWRWRILSLLNGMVQLRGVQCRCRAGPAGARRRWRWRHSSLPPAAQRRSR